MCAYLHILCLLGRIFYLNLWLIKTIILGIELVYLAKQEKYIWK